jgi:hypothetical protein
MGVRGYRDRRGLAHLLHHDHARRKGDQRDRLPQSRRRLLQKRRRQRRTRHDRQWVGALKIKHIRTKPYTPKTNGNAERFIQTALRE